jgi:hypothetical protein
LSAGATALFPTSISPDGKYLIVREPTSVNRFDVGMLPLGGKAAATLPLLHSQIHREQR